MSQTTGTMEVRQVGHSVSVVDVHGSITAASEQTLMDAYALATAQHAKSIVLNFTQLEYLNSTGIGLLVTLLVRANRNEQRMLAYGLNDHYRHIFDLTRLNEAIGVFDSEELAVRAAQAS
jgi:anti-sigma B factor antagonist